ncbi:MAG: archaeosortase/exosortase family protein [Candidatus Micrarchaeia archaeon]
MFRIKYDKRIGIAAMLFAVMIMISTSFFITPLSILDTDPSTYVIVPLLMLPLFVVFEMRSGIDAHIDKKGLYSGAALFVAFLAASVYLRMVFTFAFLSFRIDLLLFPVAIIAISLMLFGSKSIRHFRAMAVYMLFASPAVLMPIINLNSAFAAANSVVVYTIIHAFSSSASYIPPITIADNGYSIGIGESCAGIGAMIGIVMLLAPIAYFYDGAIKNKFYWLASGLLLLIALNVARMASIGFVWLSGGASAAASYVHSFAGILLFYAVIIVMLLAAGAYKLKFPKISRGIVRRERYAAIGISAVIVLSLVYLALTLNYSTSKFISPVQLSKYVEFNSANQRIVSQVLSQFNTTGFEAFALPIISNSSIVIELQNSTFGKQAPIAILITVPNENITKGLLSQSILVGRRSFISSSGYKSDAYYLISNSTGFVVIKSFLPYELDNGTTLIDDYAVFPANATPAVMHCNYNMLYSDMANIVHKGNATVYGKIESAYCIASHIE